MSDFIEFQKIPRLNRDIVVTEKIDGTNAQILIVETQGPNGEQLSKPEGYTDPLSIVAGLEEIAPEGGYPTFRPTGRVYGVWAGSRNRWLRPGEGREAQNDNFGFAAWVAANATALVTLLGTGRHFGEWWGAGVQRRYGLQSKRFSLFNVSRYGAADAVYDPRCIKRTFPNGEAGSLAVEALTHTIHDGKKVCACRSAQDDVRATIGGVEVAPVPVLYRGPWFVPGVGLWAPNWCLDTLKVKGSVAAPGFLDPEGIVVFHEASGQLYKATIRGDEKPKGAA